MRSSHLSLLAALAAVSVGCNDERQSTPPSAPQAVAANALAAYIAVSDANPSPGSEVTVSVRALRGAAVGPIGSFTLRVAYDSTRLRFVSAARSTDGMVMTNSSAAGIVVAAGASAQGFLSDELLSMRFAVTGAEAVASLQLSVSELNSMHFENQTSALRIERAIYQSRSVEK